MTDPLPLRGLHKKSTAQRLLDVRPGHPDRHVAMLIADRCIEAGERPYRFAINHDIRPPKNAACPLSHYDWTKKDAVGIDTRDILIARRWLTSAALKGYTITWVDENYRDKVPGLSTSIAIVRRRASYHQLPRNNDDDDIPF